MATATIHEILCVTRHRLVGYRVRAHSRFRGCFAPDEDDAAFRVDSPQPVEIVAPSTARPPVELEAYLTQCGSDPLIGGVPAAGVVVERLHGAADPESVALSALTAPAPGIAAWVPLQGVSENTVASATEMRLPPGVTGPLRLPLMNDGFLDGGGGVDFTDIADLPA